MIFNNVVILTLEQLENEIAGLSEQEKQILRNDFLGIPNSPDYGDQFEIDRRKYERRASVKDMIIAEMAAENMSRVRSGVWTVADLVSLTQDAELKLVLDDVNTLSFELAAQKISTINNPLITQEIKASWIAKLESHYYNN